MTTTTTNVKQDTYPMHRAKAILYDWLSNIEAAHINPAHLHRLMAADFCLDFGNGKLIDTQEKLQEWLITTASSVRWSHHYPRDFSINTIATSSNQMKQYEFCVCFDWQGETKTGVLLEAITHHVWSLEDNLAEAQAKIKAITVSYEKPFQPLIS